ncbi:hypothetical protein BD413DRAFT_21571 [Trametes elegans]|nr:hypothetical protein BD413DRAFT_21571 [Trametes elegans]
MLTLASPSRLTVVYATLAIACSLLTVSAHDHIRLEHGRRAHDPERSNTTTLRKRFDNTRFTLFAVGQNACGSFDHDNDFIVAMNTHQWDGGSHCYEEITVEYQGKTANAKITDECMECPYAAVDLSPGLFSYLADGTAAGMVYGSWNYGGGAAPSPTTTPDQPTSTTHEQPTSTPPPPPSTTSTTSHKTSHRTSTSTTSTSASTSSSSAVPSTSSATSPSAPTTSTSTGTQPTSTAPSFDTGNLNQFNLALLQLINLADAALVSPNSGA